jgi:general stress protein 26
MTDTTTADTNSKLWHLIRSVKVAMLTSDDGGHLRARPMVAAQDSFDGTLFFFTRAHAPKVHEVAAENRVCVSYADPEKQNYVSLSGTASVHQDKALVKAHWSEIMRTWFPKGIDDPEIAIMKVAVDQAEYWDAPSSTMVHAFGYVKAVVTGRSPDPGEHAKVSVA